MSCTGLSAFWCPRCGDCSCERLPCGECAFDSPSCPLHRVGSGHAQTVELADCERRVSELAADLGVELTAHDHAAVSQFAQLLHERSRKGAPAPLTLEQARAKREKGEGK